MSTSFLMSATNNNLNKPPETNAAGTVTQWVPIPTAFPAQEGCNNALISGRPGELTAWDPGYAVTVDASVKCWPSEATTWWNQGDPRTTISLGPIVCPEAYYTAGISQKDESSTLIACCPSDYAFRPDAPISIVAPISQCISTISEGQVYQFASDFEGDAGWVKTSATATAVTSVIAIPFNGWQFRLATTAAATSTSSASSASSATATPSPSSQPPATISNSPPTSSSAAATTPASLAIPSDELSTRAKVGIGVGVGIGVLLAIGILLWIFLDPLARIQHRRNADRVEAASRAQGRGRSPSPGRYQSPTPPSLREMVLPSPTPPTLSPAMSPLSPSEVLSMSSGGGGGGQHGVEPRDMIELQYHDDAAPAPVVGGMGVGRSGSAQSRHGASSSFSNRSQRRNNNYSSHEWIVTPGQPSHVRSGSQQSLYAIGSYRRPSTGRSGASTVRSGPAIGLWGIDPTGNAGRSDPLNRLTRNNSVGRPGRSDSNTRPDRYNLVNRPGRNNSDGGVGSSDSTNALGRSSSVGGPGRSNSVSVPGRNDSTLDPERSASTSSQGGGLGVAGSSGTSTSAIARSSSQRSARIMMSPIDLAGQRYEMAFEI